MTSHWYGTKLISFLKAKRGGRNERGDSAALAHGVGGRSLAGRGWERGLEKGRQPCLFCLFFLWFFCLFVCFESDADDTLKRQSLSKHYCPHPLGQSSLRSPLSVIRDKTTEDNRSFQFMLFLPSILWGNYVEHLFY